MNRDLKEAANQFLSMVDLDIYRENTIHNEVYLEDISEIVEDALFIKNHESITLTITKDKLDGMVVVKIDNRS